jgi:hypothetical protein
MKPINETAAVVSGGAEQDNPGTQRITPHEPSSCEMSLHQSEARALVAAKALLRARHIRRTAGARPDDFERLRDEVRVARRLLGLATRDVDRILAELGDREAQHVLATEERQP